MYNITQIRNSDVHTLRFEERLGFHARTVKYMYRY